MSSQKWPVDEEHKSTCLSNMKILSFWKSILTLAFFIDSLFCSNEISNGTTPVMIKNNLPDIIAGILTDFNEWIDFLSPNFNKFLLGFTVIAFI